MKTRRENKKNKTPFQKFLFITNCFYWVTIIGVIGSGLYLGKTLYERFENTAIWEKSSEVKIADEEAYVLYLTAQDRQTLKTYNRLLTKIYNKTDGVFTEDSNYELFEEFQKEYNNLPESLKERESYYYNLVVSLYPIHREFETFFTSSGALTSDLTPTKIKTFVDSYGNIVKKQLDDEKDTSKKMLVTKVYETIHTLSADANILGELINLFNSTYETTTTSISVRKDVSSQAITDWGYLTSQLTYKWDIVDSYLNEIVEKSSEILAAHDAQINKIQVYESTKENREHFNEFVQKFNEYKNSLIEIPEIKNRKDIEEHKNNFSFEITEEFSDEIKKDEVISQEPKKDDYSKAYPGSVIKVKISKGKKPEEKPTSTSSSSSSSSSNSNNTNSSTEPSSSDTNSSGGNNEEDN